MSNPVEIRLNDDGTIDEIIVKDATVHIEQMRDDCYWMGVFSGEREWHFWFNKKGRKMELTGGKD